jgi:hypothetical protein
MAESYWPFDAGSGASSTETRWRAMAQHWVLGGSGVLATELNKLSTIGDSTGMQVKVDTGRAWVAGHFYENDAQRTLAIASNSSGNPRIDRVVVRADFTANTITALVITGTPAASPSPSSINPRPRRSPREAFPTPVQAAEARLRKAIPGPPTAVLMQTHSRREARCLAPRPWTPAMTLPRRATPSRGAGPPMQGAMAALLFVRLDFPVRFVDRKTPNAA